MKDYAVVSKHEKGFWQIDVYWKLEQPPEEGDSPDHFKTLKVGDPKERAIEWCGQWCPHAEILFADDTVDDDYTIPPSQRASSHD